MSVSLLSLISSGGKTPSGLSKGGGGIWGNNNQAETTLGLMTTVLATAMTTASASATAATGLAQELGLVLPLAPELAPELVP